MDDHKFSSEMVDKDNSIDSESECEIPADLDVFPYEGDLENLPEVVLFIKRLQDFIRRQQLKLSKLRKKLKDHKSKKRKRKDVGTQTDREDEGEPPAPGTEGEGPVWGGTNEDVEAGQSLAEEVKEAAQSAMQLTGFVYEETSGMYYDYSTGYYYNAELGLYYDGNSGTYYYYDEKNRIFQFHSQVQATVRSLPANASVQQEQDHKRRHMEKTAKENKKVKQDKSCEHEQHNSGTESPEEGECSDSSEEEGASSPQAMDAEPEESSKAWPPCIRVIVKETNLEQLKVGTLFIVTCTGGTMGREGDHAVSIPDINISKHHAKFTFDESLGKYYAIDFGSRNGTYLNGKRLSVAKQESEPHEVVHGSTLQVGGTKLLCHIHAGRETCGHCEPGLVQHTNTAIGEDKTETQSKKHQHKKELKRIRRKFGLESTEPNIKAISVPGYEDRAQIRRSTVGSQDHHAKTQAASLEEPIQPDNKGFKLLMKMGWTEGQALGKDGDGCTEPVPLVHRQDKAGLGSSAGEGPAEDPAAERKKAVWRKTQKRYQDIS